MSFLPLSLERSRPRTLVNFFKPVYRTVDPTTFSD